MTEGETSSLGELFAALAKAQGQFTVADKDHTVGFETRGAGPNVKYSYATLAGVWESCRKPLSDNGLAVVQLIQAVTDKSITVNSIMGHASGQSISSVLTLPVIGGTAQAVGSAITYARRYTLMALAGIVTDADDDGQAAGGKGAPQRAAIPASKPAPKPNMVEAAEEVPFDDEEPTADEVAKEVARKKRTARLGELFRLGTEFYGADGVAFAMKAHLKKMGLESSRDMTDAQIEQQIVEFGRRCDAKKQEAKG